MLRQAHPSILPTCRSAPQVGRHTEPEGPPSLRRVRKIVDYVVNDSATANRTDIHQSAFPEPAKVYSFGRVINIIRMTCTARVHAGSTEGARARL